MKYHISFQVPCDGGYAYGDLIANLNRLTEENLNLVRKEIQKINNFTKTPILTSITKLDETTQN